MKKKRKYFLQVLVICFPLLLMGIGFFFCCHHRGFSIAKISSKLTYNERWDVEPLAEGKRNFLSQEVFSQPFYSLGAGQQCYAFVSTDQKYVLKFFKMHHLLPKDWLNDFPFSLFESYRFTHVEKRKHFFEGTFLSFKNAYELLRQETGLIYVHLNKTRDFKQKVTLISREGEKFLVDLDSKEFVVQYKAIPARIYLKELMSQHKEEEARQCVRSLLGVIETRCQKGLADPDFAIQDNYGFADARAMLIDCGHLIPDPSLVHVHNYQREVLRVAENLNDWAHDHCPELCPILQKEAQQLISTTSEK